MQRKVVFLCTTDEEIGSAAARELIEEEAKKSAYVLVPSLLRDLRARSSLRVRAGECSTSM